MARLVLEACKPQACATSFCPDLKESHKHLSILIAIQNGLVWYSRAADLFVSESSSPLRALQPVLRVWLLPLSTGWVRGGTDSCGLCGASLALQHEVVVPAVVSHHPLVGSGFLLREKRMSWKKRGTEAWLISVLGYKCPSECWQHHSVRFASLQPAPLSPAEPLAPVVFGFPHPLCSLCSQLLWLSFFFPCLSLFLFPSGLLAASPLQVSCLPSQPALPTAGISRYGTLIHFVLALGALKPSDFMGLHKLATTVAQEYTWK